MGVNKIGENIRAQKTNDRIKPSKKQKSLAVRQDPKIKSANEISARRYLHARQIFIKNRTSKEKRKLNQIGLAELLKKQQFKPSVN